MTVQKQAPRPTEASHLMHTRPSWPSREQVVRGNKESLPSIQLVLK